jgi:hypothetical protein
LMSVILLFVCLTFLNSLKHFDCFFLMFSFVMLVLYFTRIKFICFVCVCAHVFTCVCARALGCVCAHAHRRVCICVCVCARTSCYFFCQNHFLSIFVHFYFLSFFFVSILYAPNTTSSQGNATIYKDQIICQLVAYLPKYKALPFTIFSFQ